MARIKDIECADIKENTEVSEEVVQAVANAMILEAEEQDKSVEEIVNDIVTESNENSNEELNSEEVEENEEVNNDEVEENTEVSEKVVNTNVNYKARGFNSLDDALNFIKTDKFNNLGDSDKNEYLNWLYK